MKLCTVCSKFSLDDFLRLPDNTLALRLRDIKAGTRESCLLCCFLYEQLQEDLLSFQVNPGETWVRLRNHPQGTRKADSDGRKVDDKLQLVELELYAADTRFETKTENRTGGIFLGLAANAGKKLDKLQITG
jgi:hypothetical protein